MANPFVIWTFQRTGGTSLTGSLANAMGEYEVLHEPFNRGREFESITSTLAKGDMSGAKHQIDLALDRNVCIKHCFELHPNNLNKLLIESLKSRQDYRHILLLREDEIGRVCSLFLAKQTAVWGKWKENLGGYDKFLDGVQSLKPFPIDEMVAHSQHCIDVLVWLRKALDLVDIQVLEKSYELLYEGDLNSKIAHIRQVFEFLGANFEPDSAEVSSKLFGNKQGSDRMLDLVPNIDETMKVLKQFMNRSGQSSPYLKQSS